MKSIVYLGAFISALTTFSAVAAKLNLDLRATSVSGLSSGGYMAVQFHQAHADWVTGVGVVGAGPYYCAQNSLVTALGSCINKGDPSAQLAAFAEYQQAQQAADKLASAEDIGKGKMWILHGKLDDKVVRPVTDALAKQYTQWLPASSVKYVQDVEAAHVMPTKRNGGDCKVSEAPFIGNCGYDAAGNMLDFFYGALNAPAQRAPQALKTVKQPSDAYPKASLADNAFLYIPESCANGHSCRLHVSFHGCNQYAGAQGVTDDYARLSGFNSWAETNNLVVLYPQTKASMLTPFNPQGCWDWWGYTDADYATREGQQIQAVKAIIDNLQEVVL